LEIQFSKLTFLSVLNLFSTYGKFAVIKKIHSSFNFFGKFFNKSDLKNFNLSQKIFQSSEIFFKLFFNKILEFFFATFKAFPEISHAKKLFFS